MAKGLKTGGRKAGTPNKSTTEVKALAEQYTQEAVDRLAFWMRSDNPKASVTAAISLLDRGHGKAAQTVTATVEHTVNVGRSDALADKISRALEKRTRPTVQ